MSLFFQCATLFLLSFLTQCHCYIITPLSQIHQVRRISSSIVFSSLSRDGDDHFDYRDHREQNDGVSLSYSILSRRHALGSLAAIGGSISSSATCPILSARAAAAIEQEQRTQDKEQTAVINVNCLADLPPIPAGFVRVYLCRHGQTENNRLNLMQGARVDPAINDTGMAQAERLGRALANADVVPDLILHSKLQRSRQTANIASLQFTKQPKLATLATLGEVDFGEVAEGLPVEQVRSQLVATYAGWATGNLDMSMPGGETGRQVLIRVEHALKSLLQQATSRKSKCVAVVTHSTYLRMLLAVAQEQPLLLASTMEQKNCCINVVDIQTDGSTRKFIGLDSPLFTSVGGGMFSKVPTIADFGLTIPVCQVVRINEKRHLVGLV